MYYYHIFSLVMFGHLSQSRLGCNIGGIMVSLLVYADDNIKVLVAPSWHALQELINILRSVGDS